MTSSLGSMRPLQLELEGSREKRELLSLTVAIDCSCLEERFKLTTHRPKLVTWLYWGWRAKRNNLPIQLAGEENQKKRNMESLPQELVYVLLIMGHQ